ncbi:MAG TPA: MFS transporter [Acidimicrobiales bacterium]|nr:MFS transporter [Acidimicrobiales bacterium]
MSVLRSIERPGSVRAGQDGRKWWILAVLCLCVMVIGVDNTILNVALPSIVRALNASGSQLQWMVDAYTIVFACLLLTAGSLGDRYGRRGALTFGLLWFGTFSAVASTASSPAMVIAARALMGVGGAFIFPTTLSILTNTFVDPLERGRAIGVWAGVSGIGIAVGPLAGGFLVERFGWSAVFLVNVPICATALLLTRIFVPGSGNRQESPLDPLGAALSILALVPLLYGIIEAPDHGWVTPTTVTSFAVAAVFFVAFWVWELRCDQPMLDVRFFHNPRFSAASATITLTFFALFGSTFLLTEYFQFILGYSPLKAGMMMAPVAVGLMAGGPVSPRLVERWGTTRVVVTGLTVVACAMTSYASDTIMSSFSAGLFVRLLFGLGMGITAAPVTESIMGSLPPHRAGVGSAVNDTTRQTGGAVGVAVLGSVFAARYHAAIGQLGSVPQALRATARESIGTSLQVARGLDRPQAVALQRAAHHAFLASMRVTFGVGTAIVLVALTVAHRYLPARALAPVPAAEIEPDAPEDEARHAPLVISVENASA